MAVVSLVRPSWQFRRARRSRLDAGFQSEMLGSATLEADAGGNGGAWGDDRDGREEQYQQDTVEGEQPDAREQRHDADDDTAGVSPPGPKKGGYGSRIEQMLYERPDLDIYIPHAGKNTEGGGGYITYTIRTGASPTSRHIRHGVTG
jgi:hypothetical protein